MDISNVNALIVQPDKSIVLGRICNIRSLINKSAGKPLLHNLDMIPERHFETLCQRYGYNIANIKYAIMRGEWS